MNYQSHLSDKQVIDGLSLDELYTMAQALLDHKTEQWFDGSDNFNQPEFESALFGDIERKIGDSLSHSEEVEISYEISEWWEQHPIRHQHNQ